MIDSTTAYEQMRQDCLNNSFHSFGYSYIYTLRSNRLRKLLKFNTFLGIVIPLLVGGIVSSYAVSGEVLQIILWITGFFSIIQLILSALSLSYKWEDSFLYYLESSNNNGSLSYEFKQLFTYTPALEDFKNQKEKLDIKHKMRSDLDSKYSLSEKEKRKGMRYSLREFKRSCAGCNEIPNDMNPTKCGVCGNF